MEGRSVSVKEFVRQIKAYRDTLPKVDKSTAKPYEDDTMAIARVASFAVLRELDDILKNMGVDTATASTDNLLPLLNFVARFVNNLVMDTDISFFVKSNLIAHKMVEFITRKLSEVLKLNNYMDLLAPDVLGLDPNRKLHHYILLERSEMTPNGQRKRRALLVEEGFNILERKYAANASDDDDPGAAVRQVTKAATPAAANKKDPDLSPADERLLQMHSVQASEYYNALRHHMGDAQVQAAKKKFLDAIRSDNYTVTATQLRNSEKLIKGALERTKTRAQFIMLFRYLPREKWNDFMDGISNADLYRLMLNTNEVESRDPAMVREKLKESTKISKQAVEETDQRKKERLELFSYEEKYISALAFINLTIYDRTRSASDKSFYSTIGEKTNHYLPTALTSHPLFRTYLPLPASKEEKLSGCQRFKNHLTDKTGCVILTSSSRPTPAIFDDLSEQFKQLKLVPKAAYVVCNAELFYVRKDGVCWTINISPADLQRLKEESRPTATPRSLKSSELAKIATYTNQVHKQEKPEYFAANGDEFVSGLLRDIYDDMIRNCGYYKKMGIDLYKEEKRAMNRQKQ